MPKATRPTPRTHARTPLVKGAPPGAHRLELEPSPNMPFSRLRFSIILTAATTRDDAELPCCRSLAGRLPLDLGEAVGRAACSVRRPQLHGQLDMHGINYHRGRDAEKGLESWMAATSLRGCCCTAAVCGPFYLSYLRLSQAARWSRARTGHGCSLSKSSPRAFPRMVGVGCLASRTRQCRSLSLLGMLLQI